MKDRYTDLNSWQACEKQQESRDAAKALLKDLELFLSVEKHIDAMKARPQARPSVIRMVTLVLDITDYINSDGPRRYRGSHHPLCPMFCQA